MARTLGLEVIAEGVETHEQFALLRRHGCQRIQGYLVSPPLSADDFDLWMAQHGRPKSLAAVAG